MAYSKQTWTDDVSAVTGARMTHIEQGIYDNSLATDKINPSGTATTTAEIEEGQINDVIGFKSLKLKGQTSQYTTTGKNLCSGVFEQGAYNDSTGTKRISCRNIMLKANTTYTFSSNLDYSTFNVAIVTSTNQFPLQSSETPQYDSGWKTASFSLTTGNDDVYCNIIVKKVGELVIAPSDVSTYHFQLEAGNSATSYEKYSGGKASPNPDYPQDVNNVSGYNVVKIKNKNLWQNANNQVVSSYGITLTTNDDNSVTMTGSATNSSIYFTNVKKIMASDIKDGNYTLSFGNGNNTSFIAYRLRKYDGTTKTEIKAATTLAVANYTYTFNLKNLIDDNTIQVELDLVRYGTGSNDRTLYPQIEASSTASSYAKYQSNEFEINLGNNLMKTKPLVEATVNGITFTPVYDGNKLQYVNVNGTSTAVATYTLQNANVDTASTYVDELSAGTYTLSDFSGSNTPNIAIFLRYTTNGSTFTTQNSVDNKTFTVSSNFKYASYIRIASGTTVNNMKFYPQIEKGNRTFYAPYFPPIEICKEGTFQDYIFKRDGKWFKHKEIKKAIFNGNSSEEWTLNSSGTYYKYQWSRALPDKYNVANTPISCNYFQQITVSEGDAKNKIGITNGLYSGYSIAIICEITTLNDFKTWLSNNNVIVYYPIATPIEEEITYTPLIRQLDELYNSGLYDVTNISQDNSSEAFILDMEACKNNINGIVEYIRR